MTQSSFRPRPSGCGGMRRGAGSAISHDATRGILPCKASLCVRLLDASTAAVARWAMARASVRW